MSRFRSDIPIYALTPHEVTSRRVTLYRGVYPVEFEIDVDKPKALYQDIFKKLIDQGLAKAGDLAILTKGDLDGISGSTNALKILEVTDA